MKMLASDAEFVRERRDATQFFDTPLDARSKLLRIQEFCHLRSGVRKKLDIVRYKAYTVSRVQRNATGATRWT